MTHCHHCGGQWIIQLLMIICVNTQSLSIRLINVYTQPIAVVYRDLRYNNPPSNKQLFLPNRINACRTSAQDVHVIMKQRELTSYF